MENFFPPDVPTPQVIVVPHIIVAINLLQERHKILYKGAVYSTVADEQAWHTVLDEVHFGRLWMLWATNASGLNMVARTSVS